MPKIIKAMDLFITYKYNEIQRPNIWYYFYRVMSTNG